MSVASDEAEAPLISDDGAEVSVLIVTPDDYGTIRRRGLLPGVLPAMLAGLVPHAFGEATGYAFGAGDAERHYSAYEMRRRRHVTEEDRRALAAEDEMRFSEEGVMV